MKKTEIKEGETYNVGDVRGKAVVIGPPVVKKERWEQRGRSVFPVKFPDALDESGDSEVASFEAARFHRLWTDHDEHMFQENMARKTEIDQLERKLEAAGYEAYSVRKGRTLGLVISFEGDVAKRVFEKLTGESANARR